MCKCMPWLGSPRASARCRYPSSSRPFEQRHSEINVGIAREIRYPKGSSDLKQQSTSGILSSTKPSTPVPSSHDQGCTVPGSHAATGPHALRVYGHPNLIPDFLSRIHSNSGFSWMCGKMEEGVRGNLCYLEDFRLWSQEMLLLVILLRRFMEISPSIFIL